MGVKLDGVYVNTKKLLDGSHVAYVYAYRGGPQIDKVVKASREDALAAAERLKKTRDFAMKVFEAQRAKDEQVVKAELPDPAALPKGWETNVEFIAGVVAEFKASAWLNGKAESTQKSYHRYIDLFVEEFGDWRIASFSDPSIRRDLLDWRDDFAEHARTADYMISSVGALFKYARHRAYTDAEPCRKMGRLHKADRSLIIWTEDDFKKLKAEASNHVYLICRLAAVTSLRQGDLLRLKWEEVGEDSINLMTSKRKRLAVIPLIPAAHKILDQIGRQKTGAVCRTRSDCQWTGDGFRSSFGRAKAEAGLDHLHFHDMRGTAATYFARAGLTRDDLATIMGWSHDHIDTILKKYVDADAIARQMIARMKAPEPKKVLKAKTARPKGVGKTAA